MILLILPLIESLRCRSVRAERSARALLRPRTGQHSERQSPPPKFETERISTNGRGISQVGISPVAFELTKRRTRRDFVHFFRDFNT